MASNLACVGLGVDDNDGLRELVDRVSSEPVSIRHSGDFEVVRWEGSSGARLVLELTGGLVVGLLPSFAGHPGAHFRNVRMANEQVWIADVCDVEGQQLTAAAVELEQRRLLSATDLWRGGASVVAMGSAVSVYADEAAFTVSDASLLDRDQTTPSEPPAHYVAAGWSWPPRIGAESFFSYGVFGEPRESGAYARRAGTVQAAQRRVVELTGQSFTTARIQTCGFEIDICLGPDHAAVPEPGQVIAGEVFLVASMDDAEVEAPETAR